MAKKLMWMFALLALVVSAVPAMAQEGDVDGAVEPTIIGNTVCPVMGGEIEDLGETTITYDGKVYNLCCEECKEIFMTEAGKYSALAEAEVAATAVIAAAEEQATQEIRAEAKARAVVGADAVTKATSTRSK